MTNTVLAYLLLAPLFSAAVLQTGCGGVSVAARLEQADGYMRDFEEALRGADLCLRALSRFDLENALFLEEVGEAMESGKESVRTSVRALEELSAIPYQDGLERLGDLVHDFVPPARRALEELDAFYRDLGSILAAVEPFLREEAVITQLEVPQSSAEWRDRLEGLRRALDATLQGLEGLSVEPVLSEYRAFFVELCGALHKVVTAIISRFPDIRLDEDIGISEDFGRVRRALDAYQRVVLGVREELAIFSMDPQLGEIELEINRLFVERGSSP